MTTPTPTIRPIEWVHDKVRLLDQRKLPQHETYLVCEDYQGIADAIRHLAVRGAPAIGVAAAMGVALGAMGIGVNTVGAFRERLQRIGDTLIATRPTAVNLRWAVERMLRVVTDFANPTDVLRAPAKPGLADLGQAGIPQLVEALRREALAIYDEDLRTSLALGGHGATLFTNGDTVLTHCNAGALATAGFGTALAVLYRAQDDGKQLHIYVDETRPFLQGSRLTAWELQKYGMHVTVITDNAAAFLMQQQIINKIIVGADRIAANGDVANKIGTYGLGVLAKHHGIPLYVAAPCSTIDLATPTGAEIPIEERDAREITHVGNLQLTPSHVNVYNPAFDITPAALVTAIITERGVAEPPYERTLAGLLQST